MGVMEMARRAAGRIKTWSPAKRAFAARVIVTKDDVEMCAECDCKNPPDGCNWIKPNQITTDKEG